MTEIVDHGVTGKIIREISEPVGLLMINCTFIEQALSAIFEITADEVYAAGRKVRRPFGLDDKIKACGKTFRNVDTLTHYKEAVESNLQQLKKIKVIRDTFAHGTVSRFEAASTVFTFSVVNPEDDYHTLREVRISAENIGNAAEVSYGLATFFQKLATDLMLRETGPDDRHG
ncbi:hypothetical protein HA461_20455 [Rhizobium leguminosarum bv. trifolii]|uniref:hypothetical protein n=1 Tax=Rhizobium leguminosarum TaxID=384 RepID=UPI00140F7C13|nr:hypothetical protein [Rhizobium leguminosarum]QIO53394.1 hypothetical protein HA461_20455 [Rhizobium leguminosarum bv. trifolii]